MLGQRIINAFIFMNTLKLRTPVCFYEKYTQLCKQKTEFFDDLSSAWYVRIYHYKCLCINVCIVVNAIQDTYANTYTTLLKHFGCSVTIITYRCIYLYKYYVLLRNSYQHIKHQTGTSNILLLFLFGITCNLVA